MFCGRVVVVRLPACVHREGANPVLLCVAVVVEGPAWWTRTLAVTRDRYGQIRFYFTPNTCWLHRAVQ